MKHIFFATTNKGKVNSISRTLSRFGIDVIQKPIDIPEIRNDSLKEIAVHKVISAFRHVKKPIIALDAGFCVRSANGFPNTYVNFALKTIGIEGILKLAENKDRYCEFRNCLAFFDGKLKEPAVFEEAIKGRLADRPRGKKQDYFWSDLAFIFIPEGEERTLAEMSPEEYNRWKDESSASTYAIRFAEWFSGKNEDDDKAGPGHGK